MRAMRAILVTLAAALPAVAAAQEAMEEVTVTAEPVAGSVWMLVGRGGSIAVSVGEDGICMIDDQYAPLTPAISEAITRIQDAPVRFLLNTHWHGDHTGGNENFGRAGAVIVAHDNVRERMSKDQFMEFFQRETPASPPGALPVVTFSADLTFHMNGDTVHAFHVPNAHTDGDVMVRFAAADVVHTGDVYFNGLYPLVDVSSGGSVGGMIAAIDGLRPHIGTETQVIPGHGPLSDGEALFAYRDMLQDVADRIEAMIDEGKTLEEVVAAAPTAAYDAQWGGGFLDPPTWVKMLYQDLSRDAGKASGTAAAR